MSFSPIELVSMVGVIQFSKLVENIVPAKNDVQSRSIDMSLKHIRVEMSFDFIFLSST